MVEVHGVAVLNLMAAVADQSAQQADEGERCGSGRIELGLGQGLIEPTRIFLVLGTKFENHVL